MKISSVNNELVKEYTKLQQRKYRDESKLFILEGQKCIEEAIEYGIEILNIFTLIPDAKYEKYNQIEATDAVISKLSTTSSPPQIIAVAKQPIQKWNNEYKKVVLLEGIKDAGNLGTILRTSCAFNVDAVILYGDTVDLYNPKCVRASVGNLWKIPVFSIKDYRDLKSKFDDYERIATLPKSDNTVMLKEYQTSEKLLVMFGTESTGLSDTLKEYATKNVTIEMSDMVESLNLSISAGILLYKLYL